MEIRRTAIRLAGAALVLPGVALAQPQSPSTAATDDLCPLGVSIQVEPRAEPLCRPDKDADQSAATVPGAMIGYPLGVAGFTLGFFACPVVHLAQKLAGSPNHLGGGGIGCPLLFARWPFRLGYKVGAAPAIGLKRVFWDCPRAAFSPPERTGTVLAGKIVWDSQLIGLDAGNPRECRK